MLWPLGQPFSVALPLDRVDVFHSRVRIKRPVPVIPYQVLLVLDAVNALTEDGGSKARKSLADFVDQLCGTSPHLKLLVTSENSLQKMTDRCLRNYTEQVGIQNNHEYSGTQLPVYSIPIIENVYKCTDIRKRRIACMTFCRHLIVFWVF